MFRKLGMLATLCVLAMFAGTAAAGDLTEATTTPVAMDESMESPVPPGDEPGAPKKRMKPRPYEVELQKKLKKPQATGPEPKYKPWDKVVTKEHKKHEGLLNFYTKGEEVLLVINKDQLDVPMLAILSLSQGIGSDFIYGGLPIDDVMFDFHRDEDHVQMRRLTQNFRAGGNPELEKALDLTFSESILENFAIKAEKDDKVVLDVREFFLSDIAGMSMWLGGALGQPVRLEAKKGYLGSLKNFPTNTEVDTRLTYAPGRPETMFLPNVPDSRSIQIGVAWSIRQLPETPMVPRIADDRVGYFTTSHKDFSREKSETYFVHYANKWRLEKKDSTAAISEPVQPITFYIDHTVPKEYVPFMIKGTEWWNRAFEKAGFKNAIVAKPAPTKEEDPNYDPVDARYNTIRWNTSDGVSYGAIGPSRVDPRTGEIIDADILFEQTIVHNFGKSWRRVASPRTALMDVDPNLKQIWMSQEERAKEDAVMSLPFFRSRPGMLCSMSSCMELGGQIMRLSMLASEVVEAGGDVPLEYIGEALTFVAAHEVGHTLGLRHNFKSSGATPYDLLNDKSTIDRIGMTGSVMDYPTPNVSKDASKQGYYYTSGVGTYDDWAIEWGYKPVEGATADEQAKHLRPIAARSTEKANLYGTDEDTYPMGALDPRSNTNDLSDNPLAWATERIEICDDLLRGGKLESRVVPEDGDYVPLRFAVQSIFVQRYIAANVATKNIGGQFTERVHKGGDKAPFTPIPAAEQRRALDFIVKSALKSSNYELSADMLNKMHDDKMWSWENNPFEAGRRFDFPLTDWVGTLQTGILFNLMNPALQARMVDAEYRSNEALPLSELYATLTREIWSANATPKGRTAVWDRNLQRVYTDMLIGTVVTPWVGTPDDAIALSRLSLTRIRGQAQSALATRGLDDATNAHLMETVARIDRALDAGRETNF